MQKHVFVYQKHFYNFKQVSAFVSLTFLVKSLSKNLKEKTQKEIKGKEINQSQKAYKKLTNK